MCPSLRRPHAPSRDIDGARHKKSLAILLHGKDSFSGSFLVHLTLETFFAVSSLVALMVACLVVREEPESWQTLAPKYIFTGIWSAFFHLMVNVGLCGLIWMVVC